MSRSLPVVAVVMALAVPARADDLLRAAWKAAACLREQGEFDEAIKRGDVQGADLVIERGLRQDCDPDVVERARVRLTSAKAALLKKIEEADAGAERERAARVKAEDEQAAAACARGVAHANELLDPALVQGKGSCTSCGGPEDRLQFARRAIGDLRGCSDGMVKVMRARLRVLENSVALTPALRQLLGISCAPDAYPATTAPLFVDQYGTERSGDPSEDEVVLALRNSEVWCEKQSVAGAAPVRHGPWLAIGDNVELDLYLEHRHDADVERRHYRDGVEHGFRFRRSSQATKMSPPVTLTTPP